MEQSYSTLGWWWGGGVVNASCRVGSDCEGGTNTTVKQPIKAAATH